MNHSTEEVTLTPEQEFEIVAFCLKAHEMSRKQAIDMLCQLFRDFVVQRAIFARLLKHSWGIGKQ